MWQSEEVLSIVSKIAGIDLIPVMDYEIGHVNMSVTSKAKPASCEDEKGAVESATESVEDDAVVDWHTDSYPFVCVLMLSDCSKMIGGETAMKEGSGEIMKVRGLGMVSLNLFFCIMITDSCSAGPCRGASRTVH